MVIFAHVCHAWGNCGNAFGSLYYIIKTDAEFRYKRNSHNPEMPLPQRKTHILFCLRMRVHFNIASVYTDYDDFRRPVEGAMKLLRVILQGKIIPALQCIFSGCKNIFKDLGSL